MLNPGWFYPIWRQSEPEPILREVFDGWETGNGIFSYLSQLTDMPWKDAEFVDETVLDIEYFGNHSGGKFCAPLIKHLLGDDDALSSQARVIIAKIIITKYLNNWNKLWATNVVSYNPIHNYDMVETKHTEATADNVETVDGTLGRTGTLTDAYGKTITTAHGRGETDTTYRYGMNNTTPLEKPSDDVVMQESGSTVETNGGSDTQTRQLTDKNDVETVQDNESTEDYELRRAGNIGVTTSQRMLQDEREVWAWNYFAQIFKDLDNELGLMYQDPCRV